MCLMRSELVSVGYEDRDFKELLGSLVERRVSVLVDVRLTPLSRKPGLSKRKLESALAEHGIRYIHLPALGNPKDNRAGYRAHKPQSRRRFAASFGPQPVDPHSIMWRSCSTTRRSHCFATSVATGTATVSLSRKDFDAMFLSCNWSRSRRLCRRHSARGAR